MSSPLDVVARAYRAISARDLEGFLACYWPDYRSEQPLHPADSFVGIEPVRQRWQRNLDRMPDLRAEIVGGITAGDDAWVEFRWSGTRTGGQPWEVRGVAIYTVRDDRIASVRLYLDQVAPS